MRAGCGAGHPADVLRERSQVRQVWGGMEVYVCPYCGGLNPFIGFEDGQAQELADKGQDMPSRR